MSKRNPRPKNDPALIEREAEVLKLRRGGLTFDLIAERVGYRHASSAHAAYVRACKRIVQSDVEEIRKVEIDRLDVAQAAIWGNVLKGDTKAVDTLLRLMSRRAALLGLDQPSRSQVEVFEHGGDIDAEVERLAAILDGGGKIPLGE